jgi:hypothetical protein
MKTLKITLIAAALALGFAAGAIAQSMSKIDHKTAEEKIESDYKSAKTGCSSLAGNAKNICMAEAKGKESVAKAELEAAYKPSPKAHYEARVAKADADFKVAKEKCNDKGGNIKDVCVKEADAAFTSAKADAKVQEKTTDATTKANEKTVEARTDANKTVNDARKDATDDKTDAQYTVAKEKCNAFADAAKDLCLEDTKAKFGRK